KPLFGNIAAKLPDGARNSLMQHGASAFAALAAQILSVRFGRRSYGAHGSGCDCFELLVVIITARTEKYSHCHSHGPRARFKLAPSTPRRDGLHGRLAINFEPQGMKRSQDKIKDYVEPQAFDEVKDFASDPARVLAAYRFTDATSDLLARWLDALADLPEGRGAAHALAGLRGVGKSHLLATFAALAAAPELRPRVPDAHVAVSAKRLSGRRCVVIRVERGTRPALAEELHAACIAAFKREAADWPEEPVALLKTAVERTHGGTLVCIIDTAYGREQRVERDDGPLLSQLANAAETVGAFVALALDDDIAGADGLNVALAQAYQIDYLEPEHLYRVVDLYLLRKQARARAALHEIYLTLRHTVPN